MTNPETFAVTLDGMSKPTIFTLPLGKFEREDLRDELRWRTRQYYDSLFNLNSRSTTLTKRLKERMDEVDNILDIK